MCAPGTGVKCPPRYQFVRVMGNIATKRQGGNRTRSSGWQADVIWPCFAGTGTVMTDTGLVDPDLHRLTGWPSGMAGQCLLIQGTSEMTLAQHPGFTYNPVFICAMRGSCAESRYAYMLKPYKY